MEEVFTERLRRLVKEKGTSLERVFNEAYNPNERGTSTAMYRKIMRGERNVSPLAIEAVATALGVAPEEFPEYRLALARQQLDESEVGLDQALGNLQRIEAAMQTRQRRAADRASGPEEANPRPLRAAGRVARTRKGD